MNGEITNKNVIKIVEKLIKNVLNSILLIILRYKRDINIASKLIKASFTAKYKIANDNQTKIDFFTMSILFVTLIFIQFTTTSILLIDVSAASLWIDNTNNKNNAKYKFSTEIKEL